MVLIDNHVTYSEELIHKFEVRDGLPQIAVSVDMLDTGIDWCRNFEYFDVHTEGTVAQVSKSLSEQLFGLRLDLAQRLQHQKYQSDGFCKGLHDELKQWLRSQVTALSDMHISVRAKWEVVSKFRNEANWMYISELDLLALKNDVAPLLVKEMSDEFAKRFDILSLIVELSLVDTTVDASKSADKIRFLAEKLQEKASIPAVLAKMGIINEVLMPESWEKITVQWMEKVRVELRDLMKFLTGEAGRVFVIDVNDTIVDEGHSGGVTMKVSYRKRVLDYLTENMNLPVLSKIYRMEQLTLLDIRELERVLWEELGTREDYEKMTAGMLYGGNVAALIRSLTGVDRAIALNRFSEFLSDGTLNAEQEEFLSGIISYVCENGDISKETIANESPFDEQLGVFSEYVVQLGKYVDNIHSVISVGYAEGDYPPGNMAAEAKPKYG